MFETEKGDDTPRARKIDWQQRVKLCQVTWSFADVDVVVVVDVVSVAVVDHDKEEA